MNRRELLREMTFVGGSLATPLSALAGHASAAAVPGFPVIDAHIHLFDPTRPGGVPWPESGDAIYRPALPSRYEALARRFGVVGAIAIEASPLLSDNDWLLQLIKRHPYIVGMIGDLVPGSPDFSRDLERLHRDPLFLGIRYGNLWGRDLSVDKNRAGFLDGLRLLAKAGLVFETANPNPELITAVLDIAQHVPELTVVIDHLPHAAVPVEGAARHDYETHLAEVGRSPKVFVKLSEIVTRAGDRAQTHVDIYRAGLNRLWDIFGPDKVLYGSDWPNSDHVASYAETFTLVREYVASKGEVASEKFFCRNSAQAYRWQPRRRNQAFAGEDKYL